MRDKRNSHQVERGSELFDVHNRSRRVPRRPENGRRRAARFGGSFVFACYIDAKQPHYRPTARVLSLDGKHLCSRQEPVMPEHGRVS